MTEDLRAYPYYNDESSQQEWYEYWKERDREKEDMDMLVSQLCHYIHYEKEIN